MTDTCPPANTTNPPPSLSTFIGSVDPPRAKLSQHKGKRYARDTCTAASRARRGNTHIMHIGHTSPCTGHTSNIHRSHLTDRHVTPPDAQLTLSSACCCRKPTHWLLLCSRLDRPLSAFQRMICHPPFPRPAHTLEMLLLQGYKTAQQRLWPAAHLSFARLVQSRGCCSCVCHPHSPACPAKECLVAKVT
jgi:hypothetical protein